MMTSLDYAVLQRAQTWLTEGHAVHLMTVVQTWGSSPRLPGAMMALRADGQLVGSVSGGCVEDDLVDKAIHGQLPDHVTLMHYGVDQAEAQKFGIPCGGRLTIMIEPLSDPASLTPVLTAIAERRLIKRWVNIGSTADQEVIAFGSAQAGEQSCMVSEHVFQQVFGPAWRLLIIGANHLGTMLAQYAQPLDFQIMVCDPRENMREAWQVEHVTWLAGMPDDVVLAIQPDAFTAIVAVTHDPKLDDMALLEALKSEAFYVGALGAHSNQAKRRDRMRMFDLTEPEIAKLHGPVGLSIGSRTPPEIAISILAEIIQERNRMKRMQVQPSNGIANTLPITPLVCGI